MSKFIITADWHIRGTIPRCRKDSDWMETQRNALSQISDYAINNGCEYIFCVGDIFHSVNDTSFECISLVQDFARTCENYNIKFGIICGNHDLPYHSSKNIDKSPIGILLKSNGVNLIKNIIDNASASNFDEKDDVDAEMVFKHILTFSSEKELPPNVNAKVAKDLFNDFPKAKWIFTGDYHRNFCFIGNRYTLDGRERIYVINPGCLLRQASDFKNYDCGFYVVNTSTEDRDFVVLKDDEELVDDSHIMQIEERNERIERFVNKLKDSKNITLDFMDNVEKSLQKNDIGHELKKVISELLEV